MLGFNYRMTDIQAALGLSQMTNLEGWIAKRSEIARRYFEALSLSVCPVILANSGAVPSTCMYTT